MNKDFRISVEMPTHPKTMKLKRRLGHEAVCCLLQLWAFTAKNRPDGLLCNMDAEDIELAALWEGEHGKFAEALAEVGFLDEVESGVYAIHDWVEHNEYASKADERSQVAKRAADSRWQDKDRKETKRAEHHPRRNNSYKDSKKNNNDAKGQCIKHAPSEIEQCSEHAQDPNEQCPSLISSSLPSSIQTSPPPKGVGEVSPVRPAVSQGNTPAPPSEAFIQIPINPRKSKKTEHVITRESLAEYEELYPNVDVRQEFKYMRGYWLGQPGNRRKSAAGIKASITRWLKKANDKALEPEGPSKGKFKPRIPFKVLDDAWEFFRDHGDEGLQKWCEGSDYDYEEIKRELPCGQ